MVSKSWDHVSGKRGINYYLYKAKNVSRKCKQEKLLFLADRDSYNKYDSTISVQ